MNNETIYVPNRYTEDANNVDISDDKLIELSSDILQTQIMTVQYPEFEERANVVINDICEHVEWIQNLRSLIYTYPSETQH